MQTTPEVAGRGVDAPPRLAAWVGPSLPFVWSGSYREQTQVKVTRVAVSDPQHRQCPPCMAHRWHAAGQAGGR